MGNRDVTFLLFVLCALLGCGCSTPIVYDTIVIGMGASGTAAASTLAKAGKRVLALEAQNRIGGRVNTVPFGDSTVELGAEWIHGTEGSSTYNLAVVNNITILEQVVDLKAYRSDGSSDKENLIIELTKYALELVDNVTEPEPEPLGQYLTKKLRNYLEEKHPSILSDEEFNTNYLDFLDLFMNTYESSNSWNDVTTKSNYVDLGGSRSMSWHNYGYKTLFDILLNKYNNGPGYPTLEIKLNTEVSQVQWPRDPAGSVLVITKGGSTYAARNVIVTVSVGVLKERYDTLFSPTLPGAKISAVQAVSIGVCDKIIFRFAEAWWPASSVGLWVWRAADRASLAKDDQWLLKVHSPSPPMSANTSLTLWVCGEPAKMVETLPEEVVRSKVMGLIRRFMGVGRTIPEPMEMIRTSWYSNPFTRGSYSYENIHTPQHPTARADLAQPLADSSGAPRVLFAGEATESTRFSTVHGAVDSGIREANRLLSAGNN